MSMKAKEERQRKKENDEMASYSKLLLCVPFLRVPFSSQVMSLSSHVSHEYMTSVFFSFSFKIFAIRIYHASSAILTRSQILYQ